MIRFDGITIYRPGCRIKHGNRACQLSAELFPFACALLLAGPKTTRQLYQIVYRREPPRSAAMVNTVVIPPLRLILARIGIVIHSERIPGLRKRYWATARSLPQREAAE